MLTPSRCLLAISLLPAYTSAAALGPRSNTVKFQHSIVAEAGGIHNVHVAYDVPLDGHLSIHYGSCNVIAANDCHHELGSTHVGSHELAKCHADHPLQRPTRFVWLPPSDTPAGGCFHAFSDGVLVGRSAPVTITHRPQRRWTAAADIMDAKGPWFDGVAYLREKQPDEVFVASQKSKSIGIVGGGMSGLMTAHLLDSVGFHDWTILEASDRIGGRVRTSYLNGSRPDEYQYQEMGPMRFPVSISNGNETIEIQDHKMVNFIPWYQSTPNTPYYTSKRRPDGTVPSAADVEASPAYLSNANLTYSNATAVLAASSELAAWLEIDTATLKSYATDLFHAHKQALADGYLDYSEAGYLYYKLGLSKNLTDQAVGFAGNAAIANSFPYESVYFMADTWRTIDQGLSRLPHAFGPQVRNRTVLHVDVRGMVWDQAAEKMELRYRDTRRDPFDFAETDASLIFDYVVVSAPFSRVRLWHPMPEYTSLLRRAIEGMNYQPACKVALHYTTRFWEHPLEPILGGCGSTDIPGIANICYPPYAINSSGPGVLLASYNSQPGVGSVSALSEEEHVAMVQRAMVEVHGEVAREQFTGEYDRVCWQSEQFAAGAWAKPLVGQQDLYLPAYFHTEKHTVFVGEHTSYTHAWIFSALESAVRGTTQLLLDMGLVDEAKEITRTWMARWIKL